MHIKKEKGYVPAYAQLKMEWKGDDDFTAENLIAERVPSNLIDLGAPKVIKPQPGPQTAFLTTPADWAIYGGAAGSGKSWALLMEPLRHITTVKGFQAVVFRKKIAELSSPGGLWDTAQEIYPQFGGKPKWTYPLEMKFPKTNSALRFAHLQNDNTLTDWHGSQIALLMFDEATTFTRKQVFYMLSRNRSTCGVKPYVRMTCNPDPDSWVADMISWYIDQETGYPIKERSGVLRYFIRQDDEIIWGDSAQELVERCDCDKDDVKSFTFIGASIYDNQELLKVNPQYLSNLKALSTVERERLLNGNWKIRPASGQYFQRQYANIIEKVPDNVIEWVRRWDLAGTEPSESNPTPDWTVGVLLGKTLKGRIIVADVIRGRWKVGSVREIVKNTAVSDTANWRNVKIVLPQEPGQAGKDQYDNYAQMLSGFHVVAERESRDKVTRAEPFAAAWQNRLVDIVAGPWNDAFLGELEAFPPSSKGQFDDQVDASAGAFNGLIKSVNASPPPSAMLRPRASYWRQF